MMYFLFLQEFCLLPKVVRKGSRSTELQLTQLHTGHGGHLQAQVLSTIWHIWGWPQLQEQQSWTTRARSRACTALAAPACKCSFPHSQPAPHLPALGWELGTTHQQFHSKGQHKTNNPTSEDQNCQACIPKNRNKKGKKETACLETWYLQHPKKDAENCCFVFVYSTYFDTSKIIIYSNMLSGHISPGETRKAGKSPRS